MTSASGRLRAGVVEPPTSLVPSIGLIQRLVQGSRATDNDDVEVGGFRDGAESLISILGRRGSGKTTLLAAASASLERTGIAIVTPTIRPEIFDATDSLLLA